LIAPALGVVLVLSACGANSQISLGSLLAGPSHSPSATATQRSTPPPSTTRPLKHLPADYDPAYCGVKPRPPGKPSPVLFTIDDFPYRHPGDAVHHPSDLIIKTADWARQYKVMIETFLISGPVDEYQRHTGINVAAEARARGMYVSNHSTTHPDLTEVGPATLHDEIAGGVHGTYFRPPDGATNATVHAEATKMHYIECIWTIDTLDWQRTGGAYPSVDTIVNRVAAQLAKVHNGQPVVVLGHWFTNYPAALPKLRELMLRTGNRICPAPPGPVGKYAPYPIC
jgi:peptidoglycan/xylan/chitin deacetylase (PgdA/CDA1 family)